MVNQPQYLYRGLNVDEIRDRRLLPKIQGSFAQEAKIPMTIPFTIGSSVENAARNHQKNNDPYRGLFETSGVSTSTSRAVAVKYLKSWRYWNS
jgi:hypothetical protein